VILHPNNYLYEKKEDDTMAMINKINEFSTHIIGKVIHSDRATRRVAVFLPKLMPAIAQRDEHSIEIPTANNIIVNGIDYDSTIKIANTIWINA
jgi:hypothetical protein